MSKIFRPFLAFLPRADWLVIGWVLLTKFCLLTLGAASYRILENDALTGWRARLEIWNRWDALHYQTLAQFGYKPPGELRSFSVNFFPLYPWLVRLGALLTQDYLLSAFLVSGLALIAAAILLRRLVTREEQPVLALRAVWFFLIFPTAYFLHIGYTESLFLALVLGAIFAARVERWWLAGVLGAFVCLSRPTGLMIIPALTVEAIHQFSSARRWRWHWLWLLLVPCGFGVYLLLNNWAMGDPLAFLEVRRQYFHAAFAPPWAGMLDAWRNCEQSGAAGEMVGQQEFFFLLLGLVGTVVSWFRLRPVYATWMTGNWLLFASTDYVMSVPRYTLTLFPIFILFAMLGRNRFWNAAITVWSLLFLALFASLFVWGRWAF